MWNTCKGTKHSAAVKWVINPMIILAIISDNYTITFTWTLYFKYKVEKCWKKNKHLLLNFILQFLIPLIWNETCDLFLLHWDVNAKSFNSFLMSKTELGLDSFNWKSCLVLLSFII